MGQITNTRYRFANPAVLAVILLATMSHAMLGQTNAADALAAQITTLKTTVRRVNVDVIVTDSQGRAVTGLAQQDFIVQEDNASQPVRTFTVYTLDTEKTYAAAKVPTLPLNTFLNIAKTPESGTPTVILYDALNTAKDKQAPAQQELLKFLNHLRPTAQVAIFILSDRLHFVQGFADSPLTSQQALRNGLLRFADADRWNWPRDQDRQVAATLRALTEIGRFLASMPGRKNLIWYSSGFIESYLPGPLMGGPGGGYTLTEEDKYPPSYVEQIRQATDLLNLSRVAIYPVDVRGVTVDLLYNAANRGVPGPLGQLRSQLKFIDHDTAVRATMDTLADDTGGRATYGTNDFQGAIKRAITSGSTYYSLTYEPTNARYDGGVRHIKITLRKSGYNLAYRKVYYADDLAAAAQKVADAPQSPLTPSLERGTPLSHGLFLEAHLEAVASPLPATPAQMQVLSQYGDPQTKKTKAPTAPVMMQQYFISYALVARQLKMPANDTGIHHASLELGVISYDEDGRKLNGLDTHIEDTIPSDRYAKLANDGYHVVQSIAVPVTAASIRLAVRDTQGNRIGSLEVQLPLAKIAEATTPQIKPPTK